MASIANNSSVADTFSEEPIHSNRVSTWRFQGEDNTFVTGINEH